MYIIKLFYNSDSFVMFKFKEKSLILMVAASKSGKSSLCYRFLKNPRIFEGSYQNFFYISSYRPSFAKDLPRVHFMEEIPDELPPNSVVVFDDLIYNMAGMKLAARYAFRDCNHKNSIAIIMAQRLYVANDNFRMIADNCNYLILFKQLRGEHKLNMLSRDIFPSHLQDYFNKAYAHATSKPYGYLVVYIGFAIPKDKSLFSDVLGDTLQYENE
jgi:hypothetical protein